jgi:hypothetical protein
MKKTKLVIVLLLAMITTKAQVLNGNWYTLHLSATAAECLDYRNSGYDDPTRYPFVTMQKLDENYQYCQLWQFELQANGYYKIKSRVGEFYVLHGNQNINENYKGTPFISISEDGQDEYWQITDLKNGMYVMTTKEYEGRQTLMGSKTMVGICAIPPAGASNKWYFKKLDNGFKGVIKQLENGDANNYLLAADGGIYEDVNNKKIWRKIGGSNKLIMYYDGKLYCQNKDGAVWVYNGKPDNWSRSDGEEKMGIENCGGTNNYKLDVSGIIWLKTGYEKYISIGHTDKEIKCENGKLVCYNNDGSKWMYNGTPDSWTKQ